MGAFDLKGNTGSASWNFSDPDKAGYMESITGTVVEISNPQVMDYMTKKPLFWEDGNPKRQFKLIIKGQSGRELAWYVPHKKSPAAIAIINALDPNDEHDNVSLTEILGKVVTISTKAGSYGLKKPRPWTVQIIGDGNENDVRGIIDLSQPQATKSAESTQADSAAANVARQAAAAFGVDVQVTEVQPEQPELYADQDIPF